MMRSQEHRDTIQLEMNQLFLKLFGDQSFRHDEQLKSSLLDPNTRTWPGWPSPGSGNDGVKCEALRRTYDHRGRSIANKVEEDTISDPSQKPYWKEMSEACLELANSLSHTPDDPCCIWIVHDGKETSFSIFENVANGKIVGCLRHDDRITRIKPR